MFICVDHNRVEHPGDIVCVSVPLARPKRVLLSSTFTFVVVCTCNRSRNRTIACCIRTLLGASCIPSTKVLLSMPLGPDLRFCWDLRFLA